MLKCFGGQAPRVTAAQEPLFKRFTQSSHRVAALVQEERDTSSTTTSA